VRCPICQRKANFEGNPFRPFCSERCKLIDLDNWLAGRYRVPAPVESSDAGAAESVGGELGESDSTAGK